MGEDEVGVARVGRLLVVGSQLVGEPGGERDGPARAARLGVPNSPRVKLRRTRISRAFQSMSCQRIATTSPRRIPVIAAVRKTSRSIRPSGVGGVASGSPRVRRG